jgi:hypothetical protein
MAFANSALSDIISTTIQSRSGDLADNVLNNIPLLYKLKQKGNVRPFSGGNVILEEIAYSDSTMANVNSYSGYESINVAPNSPISAAQFPIAQYAAAVTMSGLEMLQNSGKQQIIDLMEGRIQIAEKQLLNRINQDLYLDGTGNSGKNLTGLGAAVSATPSTGIYGGIDPAVWSFWRNIAYSGLTNGGAAVSPANIQQYMTYVAINLIRNADRADLIVADNNFYQYYVNSLQAIQKVSNTDMAGAGFTSLKFYGGGTEADVVLGGGVLGGGVFGGEPANRMYFLNTNYLSFRPHADRNFVPIGGERMAVNQDAVVKLIGWAGNLTCRGRQFHGLLTA